MENSRKEKVVSVALPLPFDHTFDYLVPLRMDKAYEIGSLVKVPFARRKEIGIIWYQKRPNDKDKKNYTLKEIEEVEELTSIKPISVTMLKFIEKAAHYYSVPLGVALSHVIVTDPFAVGRMRRVFVAQSFDQSNNNYSKKLIEAWKILSQNPETDAVGLQKKGVSRALSAKMAQEKMARIQLKPYQSLESGVPSVKELEKINIPLNEEQKDIVKKMLASFSFSADCGKVFKKSALTGLTGSGKTNVYLELVRQCLINSRQALIILPEIGLSEAWVKNFTNIFGFTPLQWHSGLAIAKRRNTYLSLRKNQALVLVGARSAALLPFAKLGLIVIDEEQDSTLKQSDRMPFHARELSVLKADSEKIHLMLVSATISLEVYRGIKSAQITRYNLSSRIAGAKLPIIKVIDLNKSSIVNFESGLTQQVIDAIQSNLIKKEQTLIFAPRRGFAPVTLCRSCGHHVTCLYCSSWMVQHKLYGALVCHHCGYRSPIPDICPSCAKKSLRTAGGGAEQTTQAVEKLFPDARVAMATSDILSVRGRYLEFIQEVLENNIDIIVGTHLLAHGYHFPNLTLVVHPDAGSFRASQDFRSVERTYQLLTQLGGRAGRENKPGVYLLQTREPESYLIKAVKGEITTDSWLEYLLSAREKYQLPPTGLDAAVIVSSLDAAWLEKLVRDMAKVLPNIEGAMMLGPAPAPIFKLRERYRYRFWLRVKRGISRQKYLNFWLADCYKLSTMNPNKVFIKVDIDPYDFE